MADDPEAVSAESRAESLGAVFSEEELLNWKGPSEGSFLPMAQFPLSQMHLCV